MSELKKYREKRDFQKTGEPEGSHSAPAGKSLRFVVQKHAARRLHYDLRLEMEDVLRSWAVPRGPSLDPAEKRLAVGTEDHPLEYLHFEGVIPRGEYGAGSMIVWDQGTYECIGKETNPVRAWHSGTLDLRLHGEKLLGHWVLVKIKGSAADWLLIKKDDQYADARRDLLQQMPESVLSGLEVGELVEGTTVPHQYRYQRLLSELQLDPSPLDQVPRPMLPSLVPEVPEGVGWVYELKYDGFRCRAEKKTAKSASILEL